MESLEHRLKWTADENPELDLPAHKEEDGEGPPKTEEETGDEKRQQFQKAEKTGSRDFEEEGDIAKPEFMATKVREKSTLMMKFFSNLLNFTSLQKLNLTKR